MTIQQPLAPLRRTRGRPRPETVAVIEEVLFATARAEFIAHGYGGASLARIVRNAGISKTTLWSRYPDKAALFRVIIQRQMEEVNTAATLDLHGSERDLAGGLIAYGRHALSMSLQGDVGAVSRLIAAESGRFPEIGQASLERSRLGVAQVAEFIRHCTEHDALPCRDPQGVAETFIGALRGWYANEAIASGDAVPLRQREAYVARVVELLLAAREKW